VTDLWTVFTPIVLAATNKVKWHLLHCSRMISTPMDLKRQKNGTGK